jgi:hypothetical protein
MHNGRDPDTRAERFPEARRHHTIREGITAGVVGASSVALWFFVLDVFQGRLLFTPAALGSSFLFGARNASEVQTTAATVLGYTLVHGAVFIAIGLLTARLIHAAQKRPIILLGMILLFVTLEVFFVGLMAIIASWLIEALTWWTIAIANLVAGVSMGIYLLRTHPQLKQQLRRPLEEEEAQA